MLCFMEITLTFISIFTKTLKQPDLWGLCTQDQLQRTHSPAHSLEPRNCLALGQRLCHLESLSIQGQALGVGTPAPSL